jgi:hypothetical protein
MSIVEQGGVTRCPPAPCTLPAAWGPHPEQRALAAAIGPHQQHAVPWLHLQGELPEQRGTCTGQQQAAFNRHTQPAGAAAVQHRQGDDPQRSGGGGAPSGESRATRRNLMCGPSSRRGAGGGSSSERHRARAAAQSTQGKDPGRCGARGGRSFACCCTRELPTCMRGAGQAHAQHAGGRNVAAEQLPVLFILLAQCGDLRTAPGAPRFHTALSPSLL